MVIIDRYILWMFLWRLIICFVSLLGLYVVVDCLGHLDQFLTLARRLQGLPALLVEFYGPRALTFFDRISGLLALLSATFAAVTLQRSHELGALLAAGISKVRVVRPIIGGAVGIALLAAVNRELLIPHYRDQLMRDLKDWEGAAEKPLRPRYDKHTDILIGGQRTQAAEQRILQPVFRLPYAMGGFGTQLAAREAYYCRATADRPEGYLLAGVHQPEQLASVASFALADEALLLSPKDTPGLEPDQCFVVSAVSFEQLAATAVWQQLSGTPDLVAALHNPSLDPGADLRVAVHTRLVQPLLDVVLLFLGLPFVLARESRNIFAAAGMCLVVVAVFFLVVLGCQAMGTNSYLLNPALAAWCPLLIFAPVARVVAGALGR
jgi:lipopolysaccharide export system permease protein